MSLYIKRFYIVKSAIKEYKCIINKCNNKHMYLLCKSKESKILSFFGFKSINTNIEAQISNIKSEKIKNKIILDLLLKEYYEYDYEYYNEIIEMLNINSIKDFDEFDNNIHTLIFVINN